MNRTGAPADCWLLCMIHASYILNHLSCEALGGNVPLGMLYGISPDISIILLYTFYQPVFYATHNQSYPSVSEERAARWVGFGEHVGDALTHNLLDDDTKKILYRSAVRPSDPAHPNKILAPDGGESPQTPKPIVFVRSRQDDSQSATKPMAEYNPDTFLSMFRLCSCGTKPQRSENHHFVMTSSWEPQCHHDIIMRTPRITGKPKFSCSGGP